MKRSKGAGGASKAAKAGAGGRQGTSVGATCLVSNQAVLAACRAAHLVDFSSEVAAFIAQTVEYQVREVVEDAIKVRNYGKREQMRIDDLNFIIQLRGGTPLYGYGGSVDRKETTAGDGSSRVVVMGERTESLEATMKRDLPKVPREPCLVLHWLAIDGVQPAIPYNPPQNGEARNYPAGQITIKRGEVTDDELLRVPESTHPLSEELELYFSRVIKTLYMGTEAEQRPVLQSLVSDTGLHELLPYFSYHLHVTVNRYLGTQSSLAPFWALMKLFRCLVLNKNLHLDLYFHQMAVGVATVIVHEKLTRDGDADTAPLRLFAAKTLGIGVARLSRAYPFLASQLCNAIMEKLEEFKGNPKFPLRTIYGAIVGLRYLGGGLRLAETQLLPMARLWMPKLEKIIRDPASKPRRRRTALQCHAELIEVLGEYLQLKQANSSSLTSSLEPVTESLPSQSQEMPSTHRPGLVPYAAQHRYREIITWL